MNILIAPIAIPMLTAIFALLLRSRSAWQCVVSLVGSVTQLGFAIVILQMAKQDILVLEMSSWATPFGITFAVDMLGASMILITAIMGLAVLIYSLARVEDLPLSWLWWPMYQILIMGVSGAFSTGDLFNLYVWFEVLLIASFVLLTIEAGREQIEGALKYVTLNLVSSAIFLAAVGLVYAATRTLNMAQLSVLLAELADRRPWLVIGLSWMFLVSFGIKAGIFPLYSWLPSSYHTPPTAVSAIFAGLLTKVGVYALIRTFTLIFPPQGVSFDLLLWIACLTMFFGVLGAVSQYEIRRILGFHIISQIGYMVLGLALVGSEDPLVRSLGLTGAIFYILHHIIVKTNLYLIAGGVRAIAGSFALEKVGGLMRSTPWLVALFFIPAMSLAGIPPLSGFWAKFTVVKAGLVDSSYIAVVVALVAGLLTLVSMVKIWNEAMAKEAPTSPPDTVVTLTHQRRVFMVAPIVALAAMTLVIGLMPGLLFDFSQSAAEQILDKRAYQDAVLGMQTIDGGDQP